MATGCFSTQHPTGDRRVSALRIGRCPAERCEPASPQGRGHAIHSPASLSTPHRAGHVRVCEGGGEARKEGQEREGGRDEEGKEWREGGREAGISDRTLPVESKQVQRLPALCLDAASRGFQLPSCPRAGLGVQVPLCS